MLRLLSMLSLAGLFLGLLCITPLPGECDAVLIDPSIIEKLKAGLQVVDTVTGPDLSPVDVQYVLAGQGYHRTLRATLWRNTENNSANGYDMAYVMAINITSNFYIDLDQISEMVKFGGPDVISSGHIDTEKSAIDSDGHLVLVYVTMENRRTEVEVPLHLRYLATGSSPYSVITIPTPLPLSKTTKKGVSLPCSPSTATSLCHWHPSPLTSSPPHSALVVTVPVGQISHTTIVAIVTVTITFSGMLYLTYIIH